MKMYNVKYSYVSGVQENIPKAQTDFSSIDFV